MGKLFKLDLNNSRYFPDDSSLVALLLLRKYCIYWLFQEQIFVWYVLIFHLFLTNAFHNEVD